MNYVIIGNSAAGVGAVEGIRRTDAKGGLTVVAREPHHTYSRPLISYLVAGNVTEEKMRYRGAGFYAAHDTALLAGTAAVSVDAGKKEVKLDNGSVLPYDKLLIAAGSTAFVPDTEGLQTVRDSYTFMNLDDARRLNAALTGRKRVLIIGAGLIGLKCAEGVVKKAASVTVLDTASRILPSVLDEAGAKRLKSHVGNQGVVFRLAAGIKRFEPNAAHLDGGETVPFDVLVTAAGVRPNTALLAGIAEIDQGILVNARSETTAPDIYAAGDCTQTADVSSGRSRVMAVLPNAYMQGECAGVNMAGGAAVFDKAVPMNAVGFFGLPVITAGCYTGEDYTVAAENGYKRLFYSDNRLNGYILIGRVEKAGIYTSLVRERTPLDGLDFSLIRDKPGLMAFAKTDRALKLGG